MRGRFRTFSRAGIGLSTCAMSVLLAGCGGGSGSTPAPTTQAISVSVTPATMSLNGAGSQTFSATVANDSANAGVTWSIGTGAGTLSASSTNGVTYTAPSAVTATSTVTLTATSKTDSTKSAAATITLTPIAVTFSTITTGITLDSGQTLALSAKVTNDASASGATFSVSGAGTVTPASATGNSPATMLTATGNAASTVTVTATSVTDTTKSASTAAIAVNPALSITTAAGALAAATSNAAYPGATIATSGGTAPFAFTLASGSLPAGLTLNSSTGAISGTPTGSAGTSTFTIKVTDSATTPVSVTSGAYTIAASAAPLAWVTAGTLATGTVGTAYTQNLATSGGTGAITYTLNSGTMPAGLSISGSTINGTPMAPTPMAGNVITVKATDSATPTQVTSISANLTLIVNPVPLVVTNTSLPSGTVSAAYSYQLTSTGGTGAITWSLTAGTLPKGLSLSSGGLLSGTPTETASAVSLTFKAADSATNQAQSVTATLSLTISSGPTITSVAVSCASTSVQTGQTSQCAATVIGTGSYSSAVNWSVAGIQGGNADVGTISATGLYTAPSALPAINPVAVTATSTADATQSGSADLTVAVVSLAISALSTSSPVALTPMTVTASGIDPSSPITLTFSDGAGFSVTESPIRVDTSGSGMMIVAVPLYVNPTTGATGADTVSLVLKQGSQSSPPVTVDIQDLPTVASYGATPGQISHQALIFEAMVMGQRLNQLQAFAGLPGNTVDTTAAQSALKNLLTPILNARSDVDSVISDPSTVISGGVSTASGSPVQFDATALDTMDRINGVFLSNVMNLSSTSAAVRGRTPILNSDLKGKQKGEKARSEDSELSAWINGIGLVTNLASYEESMLTSLSSGQSFSSYSVSDYATALSKTIGTSLSTAGTFIPGNKLLGISGAVFSALPTIGTALGNDTAWVQGWVSGDSALMDASQTEMNKGQADAWTMTADLTAAVLGTSSIKDVYKDTAAGASTILDMVALVNQTEAAGKYAAINLQSVPISDTTPPSSPSQGIGIVQGSINIPNSTGQSGLDLCCFNDLGITGIVDANGNYESFVPLGAANTDYQNLTVDGTDPLSGAILATETVDLSGLDSTTPITIPTLAPPTTAPGAGDYVGTCNLVVSAYTCCSDGVCETAPGTTESAPFDPSIAPGTDLSQLLSEVCTAFDDSMIGGCGSSSCSMTAGTSDSVAFSFSCAPDPLDGCTGGNVTETCSAASQ